MHLVLHALLSFYHLEKSGKHLNTSKQQRTKRKQVSKEKEKKTIIDGRMVDS